MAGVDIVRALLRHQARQVRVGCKALRIPKGAPYGRCLPLQFVRRAGSRETPTKVRDNRTAMTKSIPQALVRPMPVPSLLDLASGSQFVPAPEIVDWALGTFVEAGAPLFNPEHGHLEAAHIGALWTNVANSKNGRSIVGQCELGDPMAMGKWAKAKARLQVEQWFGAIPDFILTFDAAYAEQCSDIEWCALVEHELLHAAQDRDAFGAPKFSPSTGLPIWAIRGHDVQEFTSIVRRYGADAAHVREFVAAACKAPEIGSASIAHACGVCLSRAA